MGILTPPYQDENLRLGASVLTLVIGKGSRESLFYLNLFELFFMFIIPVCIIHKIFGITRTAIIQIVLHIFPVRIISVCISPIKNTGKYFCLHESGAPGSMQTV